MVLLESLDIPLGTILPPFTLKDPNGTPYSRDTLMGEHGLLVAITCNHCPYAIAIWPRLISLAHDAQALGIHTVAINPNIHPDYPEDAPQKMKTKIKEWGIPFPYLVDEMQHVARALQAQCTPDLYLYNAQKKLVYHGRLDDNWKDETNVIRQELKSAIEALAQGKPLSSEQYPSMGCSIKWRK